MSWTLPCDVLFVGLANGGRNISRSLKLLCLKRNIGNLSAIQEKSGYLLRQRGNERMSAHRREIRTETEREASSPMAREGEFRLLHVSGLLRALTFSFGVQLVEELFKFRFLFRREDGADLIPSFLTDLLDLRIRLLPNRFRLGVALHQDRVQLLTLSAR